MKHAGLPMMLALWLSLAGAAVAAPDFPEAPFEPEAAATPAPPVAAVDPDGIRGFRFSSTAEAARLVIDLPRPVGFQERATPAAWRLFLPGLNARDLPPLGDRVLVGLRARNTPSGVTLEIPWKYRCPTDCQPIDGGTRLAITFRKLYQEDQQETLARGVVHVHRRLADASGPLDVHVLRVDPRVPGVRLVPGLARDGAMRSREPVSAMARRYGAVAGVNGSYFSMKTGEPLGLLMVDRELVSAPLFNRTALGIGEHGELFIGNTQLSYRLSLPSGETYDLDGLNQPRGLNRMVLYTPRFGASTRTPATGHEYALDTDGRVIAEGTGDLAIPPNGFVLSAHGQAASWLANGILPGARLGLTTPLSDYWPGVRHALGGGPTLVRNGEVAVEAVAEQFKPDIAYGMAPRTAVGLTGAGEVLIVTVDGRHPGVSRGLTLSGLAALLRDLGATEAMNLDGGGSTVMAIGQGVVNHPSDGVERQVNNALLVFGDPAGEPERAVSR